MPLALAVLTAAVTTGCPVPPISDEAAGGGDDVGAYCFTAGEQRVNVGGVGEWRSEDVTPIEGADREFFVNDGSARIGRCSDPIDGVRRCCCIAAQRDGTWIDDDGVCLVDAEIEEDEPDPCLTEPTVEAQIACYDQQDFGEPLASDLTDDVLVASGAGGGGLSIACVDGALYGSEAAANNIGAGSMWRSRRIRAPSAAIQGRINASRNLGAIGGSVSLRLAGNWRSCVVPFFRIGFAALRAGVGSTARAIKVAVKRIAGWEQTCFCTATCQNCTDGEDKSADFRPHPDNCNAGYAQRPLENICRNMGCRYATGTTCLLY